MFNFAQFSLPKKVLLKKDIVEISNFHTELKSFIGSNDLICDEIFVNNQVYKNGDLVVLEITDCDNIVVGLIRTILVKDSNVHFVTQRYESTRHWLQYF